ncbi:MAG: WbqC family protein [Prevotella sp.]|nr:WbqC family protein [Prevotella sp.]
MSTVLLSITYFGPVQWYQKLNQFDHVLLEQHEHFLKQTYRNRCVIATTQGLQALTVPVEVPSGASLSKTDVREVRISNHGKWRKEHWNALQSAYGESPFFEFYEDDIRPFFEDHWEYLFDFNRAITEKMCELLDIHPYITLTDSYQDSLPFWGPDFRTTIHPKHPGEDSDFFPKSYYQVYKERFGFLPNLSILDLLFNMGNEAVLYL